MPVVHVNLTRRPPTRVQVSAFYFWRECICTSRRPFCAEGWQPSPASAVCAMSIDDVYRNVTPRPSAGIFLLDCGTSTELSWSAVRCGTSIDKSIEHGACWACQRQLSPVSQTLASDGYLLFFPLPERRR